MNKYEHKKIERKWQKYWREKKIYKTKEGGKKPKCYALDMFPYPSGEGLHVGHPRGYIASDVYSRFKRMNGFNVLHPMGFDSFGLPAENYAIKNKIHPEIAVKNNVKKFKGQLGLMGFDYDWSREIITSDPNFYKWTQWIFLKMFEKGLAYESYEPINFCPSCLTGLANEDVEDGKCERCATPVVKKPMRQWVLKITDYAERLLADLNELKNWPEHIKESQRNWIGKSEGALITFNLKNKISNLKNIDVFTTRIDTVFGATYVVVAPEHDIISNLKSLPADEAGQISNLEEVEKYIEEAKNKSELQRTIEWEKVPMKDRDARISSQIEDLEKFGKKTGVELKGIKAINPFNNGEVPIWVADYVLGGYGTGAVMAVPAHDERDWEFAKKYNLPVKMVICPNYPKPICPVLEKAYTGDGHLVGSGEFDGLDSKTAKEKMTKWLEEKKLGGRKTNYKLKDWVFSRQRYWGEPIPIIYCRKCWEISNLKSKISKLKINYDYITIDGLEYKIVPVPEEDLPVKLPKVKFYEPTDTGESPLAKMEKWVNVKCPKCGGKGKRETNTMPQWAGSSWYYIGYCIAENLKSQAPISKQIQNSKFKKTMNNWLPVDMYVGGTEHATRHLIYARFWHKFLYDIGIVGGKEPFLGLKNQGLIMGNDGRKMSKRWGNVVNPDEVIGQFGADTLRVYEMFMGPFDQPISWNTDNMVGSRRFLERVWKIQEKIQNPNYKLQIKSNPSADGSNLKTENPKLERLFHQTIKKISEDIENFHFNTAISSLMILLNEMEKQSHLSVVSGQMFLKLLSPFAPHMSEELWTELGGKKSIHLERWPKYEASKLESDEVTIIVQINGKVRASFAVNKNQSQIEIEQMALSKPEIKKWIGESKIKKILFIKGKVVSIVV